MSTKQSTIDYILDQLRSLDGVSARKMFGEYALYYDSKVVGLVCNDSLFLKITPEGKKIVGKLYAEGFAYPGAKVSLLVEESIIEDGALFSNLIMATAEALPYPKPKKVKVKNTSKG
ncbi:MAG: TfoX/Sxy family protein [Candidatus Falkowbacteria bacterium]